MEDSCPKRFEPGDGTQELHLALITGHWSLCIGGKGMRMNSEEFSERLWRFAARVGKVVDTLPDTRLGRHVAGQLVRCGTSAPPNYDEACAAESKADFAHKLSIGLKELRETRG